MTPFSEAEMPEETAQNPSLQSSQVRRCNFLDVLKFEPALRCLLREIRGVKGELRIHCLAKERSMAAVRCWWY